MEGKIAYEEYELYSITFSARTNKKEYTRHEPVSLYAKAIDENGLQVMDGKITVLIKSGDIRVYKILRKQDGYEDLLQKTGAPELTINVKTVTTFPYATELYASISVSKKGRLLVYFNANQQYHNRQPEKLSKPFTVSSSFNKQKLKAGEPVTLTIDVDVSETGDYVMVEIPIPAGCSYNDKSQSWYNNEVHCEYFKHKVSIFCSSLTKGKHTFTVSLLPRYTGSYYLNPVKVELQYFPVFMGREGLKKVEIH